MVGLDVLAAQAVTQAHLLERAVHAPGPWAMQSGDQIVAARRYFDETAVSFVADFPDGVSEGMLALLCDGTPIQVRPVDAGDGYVTVRWDVCAQVALAA